MTKEQDNYKAFAGLNLSNARSEDETYEQYKSRLRTNKKIMKMYKTIGLEGFKEIFPNGVHEALENNAEEIYNENETARKELEEKSKTPTEKLGEAKQFSYIERVQLVETKLKPNV